MDAILGLLSILGFFVSFLLFVVAFLRKKAKKKWAINMAVFFAVFLFAISWPSEQANTETILLVSQQMIVSSWKQLNKVLGLMEF